MKILLSFFCLLLANAVIAQNVGIGETNPTSMKLQIRASDSTVLLIHNDALVGSDLKTSLYFKTGNYYSGAIATIGTSATHRLGLFTYGGVSFNSLLERVSILDGGNVGIGTKNPTAKFTVNGNSLLIGNANINGNAIIDGNVGIGYPAPADKLAVNGTTLLNGNTSVVGDLTVSKGVIVGNTFNTTNGAIRLNSANDNKMEYRENNIWKPFTKEYYESNNVGYSGTIRNQLIINPTFEYTVTSDGYYLVLIEANTYPVLKTNGCQLQYLDNEGAVWLYSKTRSIQLFSAGLFKWYLVNTVTGCTGGQTIPLKNSANRVVYLSKGEKLTFAYEFGMVNPPATPDAWLADSKLTLLKVE